MRFDPLSRRFVLQGAGGSLVLPLLTSLLPKTARAEVPKPVRYLQVMTDYGPYAGLFYGSLTGSQRVSPNVNVRPLAGTGTLSPMIGADFNSIKSKFSLLRGLDTFVVNANHNYCFATTASSYAKGVDNDEAPPITGQQSIDVLMAQSAKVYATDIATERRALLLNPITTDNYAGNRTFSWRKPSGGTLQMIRPLKTTKALYDTLASGFNIAPSVDAREESLLAHVTGDYQALRNSPRISAADRQKLEAYLSLVHDVETGLHQAGPICPSPQQGQEADVEAVIDNQFKLLAAAFACDLTRVATVTLGMSAPYATRHSEHHGIIGNPPGIVGDFKLMGARVARLIKILDATADDQGSVLDNSVLYWCSQYGLATLGGQHSASDMPVLIAGGARGQLTQGNYVDYRQELGGTITEDTRKGIGLKNLLVTLMNCMGLSSSDYETTAGQGYGYSDENSWVNRSNAAQWDSVAGRRAALPVIYRGVSRG
jgi:Protein of unknown function (DUF1552)